MTTLTYSLSATVHLGTDTPGYFTDGRLSGSDSIDASNVPVYVFETAGSPSTYTYSGLLSGPLQFTHSVGTLEITGSNTYTGGTFVLSGDLILDQYDSAGTGTITLSTAASLTLNADMTGSSSFTPGLAFVDVGGTYTVDNAGHTVSLKNFLQASNGGTLTFAGGGTTVIASANTGPNFTNAIVSAGTTLQIGAIGGDAIGSFGSLLTDNGALVYNRTNILNVNKAISGTGTVTQAGSGTLIFSADHSYSGTTTISAGTLQVGNGGTVGALGSGNVVDDATLAFKRSDTVTVSQVISGTGALKQIGTGTTVLTGANTYSGTTTISTGTLQIGNSGTAGTLGSGAVVDTGTLVFNRADTVTIANAISGTGALTQAGTGTTVLTATNTYGGTTTISSGALQIGNGGTTGSLGTGAVANATSLVFNRSDTLTVDNVISGAGALTQAGTGTTILTATNSYGGTTTISSGALQIGNGGTTGSLGAGLITDDSVLVFARSNLLSVSSAIAGTGRIVQAGSGTLRLAATGTVSGGTDIYNGTLDLAAAHAAGTGQINFKFGAQTLALESTAFSAGDLANVLTGFGSEDTIDLVGITASATSLGAGNVLDITTAGGHYTLHLDAAQSFAGKIFQTSSDGAGGTYLKLANPPPTPPPPVSSGWVDNPWTINAAGGHDVTVTNPAGLSPDLGTTKLDVLFDSVMQPVTLPSNIENIVLSGTGGHNVVTGNELNNVVTVVSGDWTIDGRGGKDTVAFEATRASHTVTATWNGFIVSGPEGTQTVTNVEAFVFTDKRLDVDTSADAATVFSLFQAALGRFADSAGEGYWLDWMHQGHSATDLAGQFVASAEFRSRYGTSTTDSQFVTALYQNVLHRDPDATGLAYWAGMLGAETRGQMLVDFALSPENQVYLRVLIGSGVLVEHPLA